jgi:fucose permease
VMAAAVLPGTVPLRAVVAGSALFLLAAAFSAETTGTYAFIGDIAPTARESELMGLHSTFRGFGGMVGPPIIGFVATVTSFETAFAAASLLAFGGTTLVGWRLVESYRESGPSTPVAPED